LLALSWCVPFATEVFEQTTHASAEAMPSTAVFDSRIDNARRASFGCLLLLLRPFAARDILVPRRIEDDEDIRLGTRIVRIDAGSQQTDAVGRHPGVAGSVKAGRADGDCDEPAARRRNGSASQPA